MSNKDKALLTDYSTMPYGIYKGTVMIEIPAKYLLELETKVAGGVGNYIFHNLESIKERAKKEEE